MSNPYALLNDGSSVNYMNPDDFCPSWTFLDYVAVVLSLLFF